MKRRDFIVASGSTVLSGLATSQIQRPAIGLDFEISTPDKDPSEVDSLVIEFETLEITPKYLDENETVNVQAKVEVNDRVEKSNEVQTSVVNGGTKNLENNIDSIVVDGLNVSSTISGDVTVSIDHPDIQDSYSRNFRMYGSEIPGREVWDDWEDSPTVNSLITDRQTFDKLAYQGADIDDKAPTLGQRPEWQITQGSANVIDSQTFLSLERNCLVEYDEIDYSEVDIANEELVIRFEYEYYDGHNSTSDSGFSLTVNNPGGGSGSNFAGYPEDGWTMYFGGGSDYNLIEFENGDYTNLIDGSWVSDTNPHTSELRINDAVNGLNFEYFYDGNSQGEETSNTFDLSDIIILHWGNRDHSAADNNPVGINWLEVFTR
jgi:hypothetical protein